MMKTAHSKRAEQHHATGGPTAEGHAQELDARAKGGLREILEAENRLHERQRIEELIAALQSWLEGSGPETVERYREQTIESATASLEARPEARANTRELSQMLDDVSWSEQLWRYEVGDDIAEAAARRLFVSVVAWRLVHAGATATDLARILESTPSR